jgi:atypical dual specificity phosphatase
MATTPLNFSWVIDGTLAGCARPFSERDIAFLASQGIRAVVRLTTPEEGYLAPEVITAAGLEDLHEPVRVLTALGAEQLERTLRCIDRWIDQGKPVAVSCGAGYGRTGTILACYFVARGWTAAEAIAEVSRKGRHAYEVPEQLAAIQAYARRSQGT